MKTIISFIEYKYLRCGTKFRFNKNWYTKVNDGMARKYNDKVSSCITMYGHDIVAARRLTICFDHLKYIKCQYTWRVQKEEHIIY